MSAAPVVRDVPASSRFEIRADGELAGWATYRSAPGGLTFVHTQVEPAHGGRGIGSRLVAGALDAARERGLAVLPECPFVRSFLAGHAEYQDLVPAGERARFGLSG